MYDLSRIQKPMITAILASMLSSAVAGTIIGCFFIAEPTLAVAGGVAR